MLDHYGPDQVAQRIFFLDHVEQLHVRRKLIDYALEDDRAGRYYSAVPLLLMVIDGAMNDATGKGFHASDITLDVWDSLMVADGAIYKIKEIFQKGRKKTRTERIDVPYRNGILHGMDLGYDNSTVTAKCWCFLFIVRDWLVSKKSEAERKPSIPRRNEDSLTTRDHNTIHRNPAYATSHRYVGTEKYEPRVCGSGQQSFHPT